MTDQNTPQNDPQANRDESVDAFLDQPDTGSPPTSQPDDQDAGGEDAATDEDESRISTTKVGSRYADDHPKAEQDDASDGYDAYRPGSSDDDSPLGETHTRREPGPSASDIRSKLPLIAYTGIGAAVIGVILFKPTILYRIPVLRDYIGYVVLLYCVAPLLMFLGPQRLADIIERLRELRRK